MAVPGDVRHVLPAGQGCPRRSLQREVFLEVHIVIAGQILRLGHRLEVHLDAIQIGANVKGIRVIHVDRNDDGEVIAPDAGVLGGGQRTGRLFGSQPQPVAVDGGGV